LPRLAIPHGEADNRYVGRASDDTRENTVALLREGLLDGRLGTDTFVGRVGAAYASKTHEQLGALTADLPPHRRPLRALLDLLRPRHGSTDALTPLQPPAVARGERLTLGRDDACHYVIADRSVSKRHAELERRDDGWVIHDLQSRNGTRINGWRVPAQRLRPGDVVELGASAFVFAPAEDANSAGHGSQS
jgi:hypothetical protein